MANCCENCFANDHIREWIVSLGATGSCDYCGSIGTHVVDTAVAGEYVQSCLQRSYNLALDRVVQNQPNAGFDHDSLMSFDEVFTEQDLLSGRLADCGNRDRLIEALMDSSTLGDGEGHSCAQRRGYVRAEVAEDIFEMSGGAPRVAWDRLKSMVLHTWRFPDATNDADSKTELLTMISKVLDYCRVTAKAGCILSRARSDNGIRSIRWDEEVKKGRDAVSRCLGPAPCDKAKSGRMSPEGISYMYLADTVDTCVAELRPSVGKMVCAGKFAIAKDLVLLDLTKIPEFPHQDICDPACDEDLLKGQVFMARFREEISRPVDTEGASLEYVPTQVLAEWIRDRGYDGIIYPSSQSKGGNNYVLFYGPLQGEDYPMVQMRPFTEAVRLVGVHIFTIKGVSFEKAEMRNLYVDTE